MRVPEIEIYLAAWKMLGATVIPMAFPEVFLALKQGTIDAQENLYELIYTNSFYRGAEVREPDRPTPARPTT